MQLKKVVLLALIFIPNLVDGEPTVAPCAKQPHKIPLVERENNAFREGERFEYDLKYQFVTAGSAVMEVLPGPLVNCRPTFEYRSTARSNKFIDNFFKVRDINTSIVDRASLMSLVFRQNLREGKFRVVRETTQDYVKGVYRYHRVYKGNTKEVEGELTQAANDILSAFFTTRTLPLELGREYFVDVFSDPEVYHLKIKVFPKFEDVVVPAGKFECIRIQPFMIEDGIFKARDGEMTIWLTSDERRMPVLIRSKVLIGSFDAELVKFDTPKSDMVNEQVPPQ